MTSNKGKFEHIIKDKVDKMELPYNHSDWLQFESMLSKPISGLSSSFSIFKTAAIVTVSAIIVAGLYYFILNDTNNIQHTDKQKTALEPSKIDQPGKITVSTHEPSEKSGKLKESATISLVKSEPVINPKNNIADNTGTHKIEITPVVEKQVKIDQSDAFANNKAEIILNAKFYASSYNSCVGSEILFKPENHSANYSYSWDFGDGTYSELPNPVHFYKEAGSYVVSLAISDKGAGGRSNWTYPEEIIINDQPIATISSERNINEYTFTAQSANFIRNKWIINNQVFRDIAQVKYNFIESGQYKIIHTCENEFACSDSVILILDVQIEHKILIPNAFSPDGDGINDYFGPEPGTCMDYVYCMMIFNKYGNLIFESNSVHDQWDGTISNSNKQAVPGVYVYKIMTTDKYGNTQVLPGTIALYRKN